MCFCYFCGRNGAKETGHSSAISSQGQSTNAGPYAEREAVKRLELLARSSKHSFGPRPLQGSILLHHKSWIHGYIHHEVGEEVHSAASHLLFVIFISSEATSLHHYSSPSNLPLTSFLIK